MIWKPVLNYETRYEVSSNGDVRMISGRVLKQWLNEQGYSLVRLSKPRKVIRVHRLVAAAFCDNADAKPFVNHIDCNRSNNKAENLEWCTQWENLNHSQNLGRMQRNYWTGKRSPSAKLPDDAAQGIRRDYAAGGVSWETLGLRYGISKRSVGRIVRGESYVGMA